MSANLKEPEQPEDETLLTIQDVMRKLQVSKTWCYNNKALPWLRIGGHKRLRPEDLNAYLDQRQVISVMRRKAQLKPGDPTWPMD